MSDTTDLITGHRQRYMTIKKPKIQIDAISDDQTATIKGKFNFNPSRLNISNNTRFTNKSTNSSKQRQAYMKAHLDEHSSNCGSINRKNQGGYSPTITG